MEFIVVSSSESDTDQNSDFELPAVSQIKNNSALPSINSVCAHDLSERSSESDSSLPDIPILFHRISKANEKNILDEIEERGENAPKYTAINSKHQVSRNRTCELTSEYGVSTARKADMVETVQQQDKGDPGTFQGNSTGPGPSVNSGADHLMIIFESSLCQESFYRALTEKLDAVGISHTTEELHVTGAVCWRFAGQADLVENQIVQILDSPRVTNLVENFKQGSVAPDEETFHSCAQKIFRLHGKCRPTFLLLGMEKYFRNQKSKKNREFRGIVSGEILSQQNNKQRKKKNLSSITRLDLEEAVVDLQLQADINVRLAESSVELSSILASFTRSILDAPKKRAKQQHGFSWYIHGDSRCTVKVGKSLNGLGELWVQQVFQFHQVSRQTAQALVAKYPSPQALLKAYQKCSSKDEASKLLQNIEVRRGIGPLETTKRIGPELSYKIHALLTTKDPNGILHTV